jgi:hypothetical protein
MLQVEAFLFLETAMIDTIVKGIQTVIGRDSCCHQLDTICVASLYVVPVFIDSIYVLTPGMME